MEALVMVDDPNRSTVIEALERYLRWIREMGVRENPYGKQSVEQARQWKKYGIIR
jgi:hypothetical protein